MKKFLLSLFGVLLIGLYAGAETIEFDFTASDNKYNLRNANATTDASYLLDGVNFTLHNNCWWQKNTNNSYIATKKGTPAGSFTFGPINGKKVTSISLYLPTGLTTKSAFNLKCNNDSKEIGNFKWTTAATYTSEVSIPTEYQTGTFTITTTNTGNQCAIGKIKLEVVDDVAKEVEDVNIEYALDLYHNTFVNLSCKTDGAAIKYGFAENDINTTYTAPFQVSESCTVYAQAEKDGKTGEVTSKEITVPNVYRTLKELVATNSNGEIIAGGDFEVIYQKGSDIIVTDGTSNALISGTTASSYPKGTKISTIIGQNFPYSGENNAGCFNLGYTSIVAGGNGATAPEELTSFAGITVANNLFDQIAISKATVSNVSGKTATLTLNGEEITLYNQFNLGSDEFTNIDDATVKGFVWRNGDIATIAPISIEEGQPKADPNLSFAQSELNFDIAKGTTVSGQFVTAPEGVTATYTSSDESVVTVSTDGATLTLIKAGKATITATSVANDTYKVGKATYEVIATDSNAPAETSYKIEFKDSSSDASNDATSDSLMGTNEDSSYFESGREYVASFSNISKVFKGKTGLKFASAKAEGTITINLSDAGKVDATSIIVNAKSYDTSKVTLTVNGKTVTVSGTELKDYEIKLSEPTALTSISLNAKQRSYVKSLTVNYGASAPVQKEVKLSFEKEEYSVVLGEAFTAPTLQNLPEGVSVSYTSETPAVATVDNDGNVTILAAGTTKIIATSEETPAYKSGSASYTLNVTKKAPNLTFDEAVLTFDLADYPDGMAEGQFVNAPEGVTEIIYVSNNEEGLDVDTDGSNLYLYKVGEYTVTAMSEATDEYTEGEASYKVIITDSSKIEVTLAWSADSYTVMEGTNDPENVPTLSVVAPEGVTLDQLAIEYTSTDENVAIYGDGELVIGDAGTAVITATISAEGYTGSASFTVEVTAAPKLGAITINGQTADENGDITLNIYRNDPVTITAENALSITYTDAETEEPTVVDGSKATLSFPAKGEYMYTISAAGLAGQTAEVALYVFVSNPLPIKYVEDVLTAEAFGAKTAYDEKTFTSDVTGIEYTGWVVSDKDKNPTYLGIRTSSTYGGIAIKANNDGAIAKKITFKQVSTQTLSRDLYVYGSTEPYKEGKGLKKDSDVPELGYKTSISGEDVVIDLSNNTNPYISLVSGSGALQMEYIKIEYAVVDVDKEKLTPAYSEDNFSVAPNGDGFILTITHETDYDGVTLHYLHTPATTEAEQQSVRRRATNHGDFQQATSEDGINHTIELPSAGKVDYYGYHADTDTKGVVRSLAIDGEGNTTSIESIMLDGVDPQACYDLQGRRLLAPVRGINIINGRKYLLK